MCILLAEHVLSAFAHFNFSHLAQRGEGLPAGTTCRQCGTSSICSCFFRRTDSFYPIISAPEPCIRLVSSILYSAPLTVHQPPQRMRNALTVSRSDLTCSAERRTARDIFVEEKFNHAQVHAHNWPRLKRGKILAMSWNTTTGKVRRGYL